MCLQLRPNDVWELCNRWGWLACIHACMHAVAQAASALHLVFVLGAPECLLAALQYPTSGLLGGAWRAGGTVPMQFVSWCRFMSVLAAVANALEAALVTASSTSAAGHAPGGSSTGSGGSSRVCLVDLVERDYGISIGRAQRAAMDAEFATDPLEVSSAFNAVARCDHPLAHPRTLARTRNHSRTGGWWQRGAAHAFSRGPCTPHRSTRSASSPWHEHACGCTPIKPLQAVARMHLLAPASAPACPPARLHDVALLLGLAWPACTCTWLAAAGRWRAGRPPLTR